MSQIPANKWWHMLAVAALTHVHKRTRMLFEDITAVVAGLLRGAANGAARPGYILQHANDPSLLRCLQFTPEVSNFKTQLHVTSRFPPFGCPMIATCIQVRTEDPTVPRSLLHALLPAACLDFAPVAQEG